MPIKVPNSFVHSPDHHDTKDVKVVRLHDAQMAADLDYKWFHPRKLWFEIAISRLARSLESVLKPNVCVIFGKVGGKKWIGKLNLSLTYGDLNLRTIFLWCENFAIFTYRNTLRTRIVAGELMTESFRFLAASISGGSSLGFEDADVAITVKTRVEKEWESNRKTLTHFNFIPTQIEPTLTDCESCRCCWRATPLETKWK